MSGNTVLTAFRNIRWTEINGEPVCHECSCHNSYDFKTCQFNKCKVCHYLSVFAVGMAWREDCRHEANGNQFAMIIAAVTVTRRSRQWCGYWQCRA